MFEKLFMLVKNNAGMAVVENPVIPAKYHEAVINDASSSIIEVLKGQVENGKLKDMIKYFQFPGIYNNPLIDTTVNKFANKLNNFYDIEPVQALQVAKKLIPPVMQEMIQQSKSEQNTDFALSKLLSMLGGNYNPNNLAGQSALA
ncbi:hypothetical protein [Mucilaginibacter sp. UR6-11]|uniref:hypothetical protein n=1 Tax=Mucilaginibacter sp. UR6-11 TaxID=1435644 RepID=UPI001E5EC320|nr:hypothetical protein [Mucilaginibacter sp. UR6-11]MCC8425103.1 hypothetical protein [Mucilaginibacter sp. UR6-11]